MLVAVALAAAPEALHARNAKGSAAQDWERRSAQAESARHAQEEQRWRLEQAHAQMPDTMYASTPDPAPPHPFLLNAGTESTPERSDAPVSAREELARKTAALTGVQWERHIGTVRSGARHSGALTEEYRLLYGGIATEGLQAYAEAIPPEDELEQEERYDGVDGDFYSNLRRQAQLTVLAFKTGVAVSADLWLGGFDTHSYHDSDHEWLLGNLTDSVDYLWEYAEEHGVADRMVVVIGSDVGRTNFYNAQSGKDHWPIGSYIVMEKSQSWAGRAVGETDGLHFAQRVNPRTLRRDDRGGTIIYPKHVHKALRRYLGIENSPGAQRFPFNNTEDFAFFG